MAKKYTFEFVQIETDKFPVQPGEEDEIFNPGMYGRALSEYLEKAMRELGYETFNCAEDWGWWVDVRKDGYNSGLGVYCTSEPPACKTYAVCDMALSDSEWSWKKLRKISYKENIRKLRADFYAVFENDPDIKIIRKSDNPWGHES